MKFRWLLVVLSMVVFASEAIPARAATIQYSWYGLLVPNVSDGDDPWQLSTLGNNFELGLTVSTTAKDLFDQNVEYSAFEVDDAQLILGGEQIRFIGPGFIDLTDDWSGYFDIFTFAGYFERLGILIEIGTAVVLPLDIIQLSEMIEKPSVFRSTKNVAISVMGVPGPYTGIVGKGTPVIVTVPEPLGATLLIGCCIVLIVARDTQPCHRRAANGYGTACNG